MVVHLTDGPYAVDRLPPFPDMNFSGIVRKALDPEAKRLCAAGEPVYALTDFWRDGS
jgi:hypothetical protein